MRRIPVKKTQVFPFWQPSQAVLISMMRWINAPQSGTMDEVMTGQAHILREQMNSSSLVAPPEAPDVDSDDES